MSGKGINKDLNRKISIEIRFFWSNYLIYRFKSIFVGITIKKPVIFYFFENPVFFDFFEIFKLSGVFLASEKRSDSIDNDLSDGFMSKTDNFRF